MALDDPVLFYQQRRIAELAAKNGLAAIAGMAGFVEAGLLMSYGTDFDDHYRKTAVYVAKILNGAKPADLPVEQPTKIALKVNLKTAKALGQTIPASILLRADRVIE